MKYLNLILVSFILLLFINFFVFKKVYGQMRSGTAKASVSVNTNTQVNSQNESKVHTKIEVSVNGEKKIIESNKPGNFKVEVDSNGKFEVSESSPSSKERISPSPKKEISQKTKEDEKKNTLIKIIRDFISSLLNFFK